MVLVNVKPEGSRSPEKTSTIYYYLKHEKEGPTHLRPGGFMTPKDSYWMDGIYDVTNLPTLELARQLKAHLCKMRTKEWSRAIKIVKVTRKVR